jgi:hypothetical protein
MFVFNGGGAYAENAVGGHVEDGVGGAGAEVGGCAK